MVAGADPNLRDWSGQKPRQYQPSLDTSVSADTFRSEYLSDRLSSMMLSTDTSSAANNTLPKTRKSISISHRSFLRKSFMHSDHKKYRHTSVATLHEWLSHVTGIVNLSGLLLWIMKMNENPYGIEKGYFIWGMLLQVTPIAQHCVFFNAGYT